MARLDPPIVIGDVRWDAVEFSTYPKGGVLPVFCAWYTPKKKDGTWAANAKRVWASHDPSAVPTEVAIAGAYARMAGIDATRERLDDEERLLRQTIAVMKIASAAEDAE